MSLIAMFGLFRAAKFWVALAMGIVQFVRIQYGIDIGLDEATATAIIGGIGALLVWWVPNLAEKKPDESAKTPSYALDQFPPRPGPW
jgi:hypothetical protein